MERHDTDPLSLVLGLVFALVGLLFLVGGNAGRAVVWLWPAGLVALGGLILALSVPRRREGDRRGEPAREPLDDDAGVASSDEAAGASR